MNYKWEEKPIAELADIFDGPHATPTKTKVGPVFLGISNLAMGRLNLTEVEHISEDDYFSWIRRIEPHVGDIVFSYETRIGEAAIIPPSLKCCLGRRMGLLRAKPDVVNNRFLLYAYLGPKFQETLRSRTIHGSTVDRIPLIDMPNFPISIPTDIGYQHAIASMLGSLDDKIELNRNTCQTLEEIGKVLFKSWFVDFDPVRAKMAGEKPASICARLGLTREVLDLFPNKLVDSELGEIPAGWKTGTFSSIVSKRNERVGSQKVIILSAIASGELVRSDDHFTKQVYSEKTDKYLLVEQWDFAFNPSRINIGSIGLLEEDLKGGVSPVYVVVRPDASYRWFLRFSLQLPQTRTLINTLSSGSVRQSLSFYDFSSIPSVIPPAETAQEFDKRWLTLRKKIRAFQTETSNLKSIRDGLLPKIISGEIEVPLCGSCV